MATIDIRRAHSLDVGEAQKRAERLAEILKGRIGIRWWRDGDGIRFDAPDGMAKGTTGVLHVAPHEIRVEVSLPFLLSLGKGAIERQINANLDEALR